MTDNGNGNNEYPTVIGTDAVLKGELTVEKGVRIEGQIEGLVSTKGKILVGKSGMVKADVRAGTLTIEGKINGNVIADTVKIEASGQVMGDLSAVKLTVSEGATFVGKVSVGPEAGKQMEAAPTEKSATAPAPASSIPAPVAARMSSLSSVGNGKH